MTPDSYGPLAIYAVLFTAIIFAPIRWSLIAYFWIANVDLPDSAGGFGVFNVLKAFLLPVYLLWRLRRSPGNIMRSRGGLLWIAFTFYVGIAGLWSLFPMAALKFVGHLAGSLLICAVLVKAVAARKLGTESAPMLALGALGLAILRSIILPDFADSADRFSSFVTAQSFASFLAALYCILLFPRSLKWWFRMPILAALAVGMVLNGSRMWGFSIVLATLLGLLLSGIHRHWKVLGILTFAAVFLALFALRGPLLAAIAEHSENNRIADAITALGNGDERGTGLGTFRFRKEINELALSQISESPVTLLLFGHGTSNAAAITGSLFKNYYAQGERMDPNRMLHNEWLRVVYEWGLLGFTIWIGFIGSICALAWKGVQGKLGDAAKPLCVYLPGFLVNLAGENILAGAGNVVNMGFLLVIALAYASGRAPIRAVVLRRETAPVLHTCTPQPV